MEELAVMVSQVLGIDVGLVTRTLHRDDVYEWDSLGHLRLITELEEKFGVSVPIEDFARIHTIGDLEKYLV